jgi:hypothetical protein
MKRLSPAIEIDGAVWAGPNHSTIVTFLLQDPTVCSQHNITIGFSCGGEFITREEAEDIVGSRYTCDGEPIRPYPNVVQLKESEDALRGLHEG